MLLTLVAITTASVAAPVGAVAARERGEHHPLLVAAKDEADDVRITKDKGLPEVDRRSVELKKLIVTDRGKRVRFDLRLGRVDRSDEFTQIVFINVWSKELPWSQLMLATHSTSIPEDPHGIERTHRKAW